MLFLAYWRKVHYSIHIPTPGRSAPMLHHHILEDSPSDCAHFGAVEQLKDNWIRWSMVSFYFICHNTTGHKALAMRSSRNALP
jgi:hypothetical protein